MENNDCKDDRTRQRPVWAGRHDGCIAIAAAMPLLQVVANPGLHVSAMSAFNGLLKRAGWWLIPLVNLGVTFSCCDWYGPGRAFAGETVEVAAAGPTGARGGEAGVYRTPLAGEAGEAEFRGETIRIPAVDRSHMTSITLGGSLLEPKQGDSRGLPIAALYLRQVWEGARTRDLISVFVNELEYDKTFGNLELVGHFENYTLPLDQTEIADNTEVEATSLQWGTLVGSIGPGLRFPVFPHQVDNDVRLQLLARVGYFYAGRTSDTGPGVLLPPDTMLYGARLRGRYDGMRRNLLELPHQGFATGFDLDYMHRDRWSDLNAGSTGSPNRDYFQGAAYVVGAGGIPGLSERDRVLFCMYGGKTSENDGDRFNAFRINGAPFPGEGDDMARPRYTGVVHESAFSSAYATASLGYRRELAFFLYLSLVGSYLWADSATVQREDQVVFRDRTGGAATVALDSAFFWNSSLYLAYAWESGFFRRGESGGGITFNWNKLF